MQGKKHNAKSRHIAAPWKDETQRLARGSIHDRQQEAEERRQRLRDGIISSLGDG
jgi:hypothetical protein